MKNYETIYAYGGYILKAELEESMDDIHLCIGYTDHGDDFIYVQTKDEQSYIYGYWCNRNWQPDYETLLEHPTKGYVRLPELFKAPDKNSWLSNSIYHDMDFYMHYSDRHSKSWNPAHSDWDSKYKFEHIVDTFQKAADSGIKYDWEDKRNFLFEFLERYGMDTPENHKIVEDLPMSSRVNGFDGIAAKKIDSNRETLCFDELNFVIKDGVEMSCDKIVVLEDTTSGDEWGFYTSYLDLDQFEDDAKDKVRKECEEQINEMRSKLNNLSNHLSKDIDLEDLIHIRSMLTDVIYDYYIPEYEEDQDETILQSNDTDV